ncbi:amylo-alpha-1,6-glucosidase [Ferroplasma acidiphilum]|uniref:amylo-alpha-1,6-glucosidase n=1 Tax=Ferroplasma acidiphilum TaxID=74969 RepID=UPI0023EF6211|nr:amylo-alpha-1,6-glucosidase [Ferroplasma acidiphilum]
MNFKEEWLIANSKGSYSSSTISFANTRTYHGILVKSEQNNYNRYVILSKLYEELAFQGKQYAIDTNYYPGTMWPEGFRYIQGYSTIPYPSLTFNLEGNICKKSLILDPDADTVVIRYEFPEKIPDMVNLYPLLALRSFHNVIKSGQKEFVADEDKGSYSFTDGIYSLKISKIGKFINKGLWYYNFIYPEEQERGTNSMEDLYMPGVISISNIKSPLDIAITTDDNFSGNFPDILQRLTGRGKNNEKDPAINALRANSYNFRLKNDLIAGFHWFGPWARDTFISMPGLVLIEKNFDMAMEIFLNYVGKMKGNLIPNNLYNRSFERSADAPLWFIYALYKYYAYSNDSSFVRSLFKNVKDIINSYISGNEDFSLDGKFIKVSNAPMTWMDAKNGNTSFTPRTGKPVEINALWYNSLKIYTYFCKILGEQPEKTAIDILSGYEDEFTGKFIINGEIADTIDPVDTSFRPNFLFAYSLPFPLLNQKQFLEKARLELVTPYGLRSLSPRSNKFAGTYSGPVMERDRAYHNGTVWPWLAGPYITACVRNGYDAGNLYRFFSDLYSMEMVPEIFDGLSPGEPRGCIMQAWSYGELIRAYYEDIRKYSPGTTVKRGVK